MSLAVQAQILQINTLIFGDKNQKLKFISFVENIKNG
jgi:hypothetical protein